MNPPCIYAEKRRAYGVYPSYALHGRLLRIDDRYLVYHDLMTTIRWAIRSPATLTSRTKEKKSRVAGRG